MTHLDFKSAKVELFSMNNQANDKSGIYSINLQNFKVQHEQSSKR